MTVTEQAPRNTAELAQIVCDAHAARTPLRLEGRGGWSAAGTPAGRIRATARPVSLAAIAGVVAYVPADLTLTLRAGTTLAELNAITAEHNQWCPLLAWGDDTGTVGATFATATGGPCAAALGRPRDIALGIEFVDGAGMVVRGGGRVVKNVAGFDLTRLLVGSFGSLGAITEVTVRLRARPAVDVTWCVTRHGATAGSWLGLLQGGAITPLACEVPDDTRASALGLDAGSALVRYAGNAALVAAAKAIASSAGSIVEVDASVWTRYRALDPRPRRLDGRPLVNTVAARIKERFDPAGILNPGVFGEQA